MICNKSFFFANNVQKVNKSNASLLMFLANEANEKKGAINSKLKLRHIHNSPFCFVAHTRSWLILQWTKNEKIKLNTNQIIHQWTIKDVQQHHESTVNEQSQNGKESGSSNRNWKTARMLK